MKKITIYLLLGLLGLSQSLLAANNNTEIATFAGGCFWCLESDMDKVAGVLKTTSGYMGGHIKNPTYKQVSAGNSGHAEVVQISFDPKVVSYEELLKVFWKNIDPTVKNQQFCDHGSQYRSIIFYHNSDQKNKAMASLQALEKNKPFSGPIYTEIVAATTFYSAEDYHQDYYKKNPIRYKYYRFACGRDARLSEIWGK